MNTEIFSFSDPEKKNNIIVYIASFISSSLEGQRNKADDIFIEIVSYNKNIVLDFTDCEMMPTQGQLHGLLSENIRVAWACKKKFFVLAPDRFRDSLKSILLTIQDYSLR